MCIEQKYVDIDSVFDGDNYFKASTVDCVCGYLILKLAKCYKCEECSTFSASSSELSTNPFSAMINIKFKGWLLHPNYRLF